MKLALPTVLGLALIPLAGCGPAPAPPAAPPPPAAVAGLVNGAFDLELDGRTLHYEVRGSGPVVLHLTNSWGLSLEGLRQMYRPLEDGLTMVYFDPRGMGGSSPPRADSDMGMAAVREDFHALREHLGLEKVHAMGWSNGAMNLILLAAERPETLESATFVHGAASFTAEDMQAFGARYPELVARWIAVQQELSAPAVVEPERTARMKAFWLGEYFPWMIADRETGAAKVRAAFEPARFSWAHAQYQMAESPSFDARSRLAAITVPSLVIAGAADMAPPEKVKELADGLPDAEFVVFEHSGHFAPLEEPERFRKVVYRFLGVVDDGAGGAEG